MPNLKQKKGRRGSSANDDEDEDTTTIKKKDEYNKTSSKTKPPTRSSKHAPTEMSSKRQVSRKREVVSVHTVSSRDPRFSSATAHPSNPTDEARLRKAYAFLDEYRDSEMSALKAAIKKARDAREKEDLARQLKSMQSKKEAQARKDAQRELIEKHRRNEKELVAQGKKSRPFYLKKAEQKKQLLLDRFAGMKKRDVQKTIERRRKKLTAKEKKNMPFARRGAAAE
jgi:ribosomal RNA-processing protein 36